MEEKNHPAPTNRAETSSYEAPEIERVLSADDLAREIHYAGTQVPSLNPG